MRVVVVEDSVLLREGLGRLLTEAGHEVVGELADADPLDACVSSTRPDLVVLDVRLPPGFRDEGVKAAARLVDSPDPPAVLLLSQYVERRHAVDLLMRETGGFGYLLKDRVVDVAEFLDAVQRIGAGETVVDPVVVRQLLSRVRHPLDRLTPREEEVLRLMAEGRSNRWIAERLVVSDGAIEKHISNIFTKLDLSPDDGSEHRRVRAVLMWLDGSAALGSRA